MTVLEHIQNILRVFVPRRTTPKNLRHITRNLRQPHAFAVQIPATTAA
jgi:hypothetical protein